MQLLAEMRAFAAAQSPNPNDLDPHWKGEAHVGTSSTFIQKETVLDRVGLEYAKGDLVSPRGEVQGGVFILKTEWDCASAEEWQKRGQSGEGP
jgi:hypothetical protein